MATRTYTGFTAVLAANLDDTAIVPVADKNGNTRRATLAQLRTQIFAGDGGKLSVSDGTALLGADALGVDGAFTNALNATKIGLRFSMFQSVATTGSLQGIEGYSKATHAAGTVVLIIGTVGNVGNNAAGTVTHARGVQGGGQVNAGTVVNFSSLLAAAPGLAGSGAITNLYGLYVAALTQGTNNWSIYCENGNVTFRTSALATNATTGHLFVPSCAGVPTGVPANIPAGQIAFQFDSSNNHLYAYLGGAWKKTTVFA